MGRWKDNAQVSPARGYCILHTRRYLSEATDVFVIHEVEKSQVDDDVRLLFSRELSGVGLSLAIVIWLDCCQRGSWTSTYFARRRQGRLSMPWQQLSLSTHQAATQYNGSTSFWSHPGDLSTHKTKPNEDSTLDLFYELIIQEAFPSRRDPENYPKIRSVLGRIVLAANPLSPSTVATLLALDVDEVFRRLSLARPLFIPQKYIHSPILSLHKPFPTSSLCNPNGCINKRFRISPSDHHPRLLKGCFNLMRSNAGSEHVPASRWCHKLGYRRPEAEDRVAHWPSPDICVPIVAGTTTSLIGTRRRHCLLVHPQEAIVSVNVV